MKTGFLDNKDLAQARKRYKDGVEKFVPGAKKSDGKPPPTPRDILEADIRALASKRARELSKADGVTDPVALERVVVGKLRKDPDGNWLFNYGEKK